MLGQRFHGAQYNKNPPDRFGFSEALLGQPFGHVIPAPLLQVVRGECVLTTKRAFFIAAASILASLLILTGCKQQKRTDLERETPNESGVDVETELLPAGADGFDEDLLVDGQLVRLEAFLWRDFMPGPGADPEGRALSGQLRIFSVNGDNINGEIDIRYVWLKHENLVWGVALPDPPPTVPTDEVQKSFTGGPQWQPGMLVDVIVRITDTHGLSSYLRVNNQEIVKTQ